MADASVLVTTEEVAQMLRTSRQTVHRWIRLGKLTPVATPGRSLRFRREEIEAMTATPRSA